MPVKNAHISIGADPHNKAGVNRRTIDVDPIDNGDWCFDGDTGGHMHEHAIKEVGIVEAAEYIGPAIGNSTERGLRIGAVDERADVHTLRHKCFVEPRSNNSAVTDHNSAGEMTQGVEKRSGFSGNTLGSIADNGPLAQIDIGDTAVAPDLFFGGRHGELVRMDGRGTSINKPLG
ncbi:unannotated protein [freshwater metagenome]|uniref:Unannotated protein n=1 Tax=freshwater metagenome TaxID=449393 RepID=A0A6J6A056_9ZZZZ